MDDILVKKHQIPYYWNADYKIDQNGKYVIIKKPKAGKTYFYDINKKIYSEIYTVQNEQYFIINDLFICTDHINDSIYSLNLKTLFESTNVDKQTYYNIHKSIIKTGIYEFDNIYVYNTMILFVSAAVINLWYIETNEQKILNNPHYVKMLDTDGKKIVVSSGAIINIFDIKLGLMEKHLDTYKCDVLVIKDDIVAIGGNLEIKVWIGNKYKMLYGHTNKINYLFITQKKQLISNSLDTTIRIWNINSAECIKSVKTDYNILCRCINYKSYYKIITCDKHKTMEILDLITLPINRVKNNELIYLNVYMTKSRIKIPCQLIGDFCEYYNNLPIDNWL